MLSESEALVRHAFQTRARAILLRDTDLANYRRARRWWCDYHREPKGVLSPEERLVAVRDALRWRDRVNLLNAVLAPGDSR